MMETVTETAPLLGSPDSVHPDNIGSDADDDLKAQSTSDGSSVIGIISILLIGTSLAQPLRSCGFLPARTSPSHGFHRCLRVPGRRVFGTRDVWQDRLGVSGSGSRRMAPDELYARAICSPAVGTS